MTNKSIEWSIKREKIENLKFYDKNPRKFTDEGLKDLKRSIVENGDANIITANADNTVLGGHARLTVMKDLGIKEVDVKYPSELLDDKKVQEIVIRLNANTAGEWDLDKLQADFDLDELGEWGLDLDFTQLEDEKEIIEDEVPEEVETRCKLGDIWQLGNHRLMCGDSTVITDVEKLMDGCYPDLIHTDPPYGMNAVTKSGVLSKNYKTDIIGDDNPDIAKDAFKLINNLYTDAKQIWWGANYYCSVLPDSECWLVWDKNNGQSDQTDCKLAWANFRSVVRQFTQSSEKTNRVHPTQKPVSLMAWIIKRFNLSSETIADFFGGSGSTLMAAEQFNKKCYVMEFDPHYCDVIITRWENFTGKQAELING